MRLRLVRHGETADHAARRFLGWRDVPLSAEGRLHARALRERLADGDYAGVWSSDLRRAVETARLARGEPRRDPRLRELDFGELEGRRWEELDARTQAALAAFDGFAAPGGETTEAFRARVVAFFDELAPGDHLVFTHGGVIRLVTRRCTGEDVYVPPCGIVDVVWGGGTTRTSGPSPR